MGRKAKLQPDDWIAAATQWIAEHGVASLAVEPLARALGVTKGGFYWCFANRDELLQAVLERWEAQGTQDIIRLIEQVPDTRQQAIELMRIVSRSVSDGRAPPSPMVRLQYALWCATQDPLVGPVVERVTAARVGFLAQVLRQAGLDEALAAQRATLGYASYVGLVVLRATEGHSDAAGARRDDLLEAYLSMLLAPAPSPATPKTAARRRTRR